MPVMQNRLLSKDSRHNPTRSNQRHNPTKSNLTAPKDKATPACAAQQRAALGSGANVCFWHKAGIPTGLINVRFRG